MATTDKRTTNSDVIRHIARAVSAGGNLDDLDGLVAEDYVEHNPAAPTDQRGPDVIRQFTAPYRAAFPDLEIVEEDLFVDGDRVAFRHRARGTHEGEFRGIPPTGEEIDVEGIAIYRMEDGLAAEKWIVFDAMGLMGQLGAAPGGEAGSK